MAGFASGVVESTAWSIPTTGRPEVMGTRHMISAGHYLAAHAGLQILEAGGNAIDAGVAAGLCLNVVQCDMCNLGGVAPINIFSAASKKVYTISGLGWWPKATELGVFDREHDGRIGGIHRSVIPSAADAWLTALEHFGTMSFEQVSASAIRLAEDGFPMHHVMLSGFSRWTRVKALIEKRDGRVPRLGELLVQKTFADTLRTMVGAEQGATNREAGIRAVRAEFYTGGIADAMVDFSKRQGGWLRSEDLAEFHVGIEEPVTFNYRGYDVWACGPWCQGPTVPLALNILEGFNVGNMKPGGADVCHLTLEAIKAAFADRDKYIADPRFVRVPIDGLLSKEYGEQWRRRISRAEASPGMPMPGDPWQYSSLEPDPASARWQYPAVADGPSHPDTTYVCVVDSAGNGFSATPSDGMGEDLQVPELGFSLSGRGVQAWLDPNHPSSVIPGKRPRLTPNPGMVTRDGRLVMPYGTPGGDVQPQAMLQFLINFIDFGLNVQESVEAPRCVSYSFPETGDPHPYHPGKVQIESRVGTEVIEELERRGHKVSIWPGYTGVAGSVCAVYVDDETGVLHGGADPRRIAYAMGC